MRRRVDRAAPGVARPKFIDPNAPGPSRPVLAGPSNDPPSLGAHAADAPAGAGDHINSKSGNQDPQDWLQLHADDLIDRLRGWQQELDAREAQLNAREAQQEQRERNFRVQAQSEQAEFEEQSRSMERLKLKIEAEARRLIFRNR